MLHLIRKLREIYKVHPERFEEDMAATVAIVGESPFREAFAMAVEMKASAHIN